MNEEPEPMADDEAQEPLAIPHAELAPDTLARVIESFVLREGTDYGDAEYSLAQKVAHVRGQLDRGDAEIFFDPKTETIDIRPASRRSTARRML